MTKKLFLAFAAAVSLASALAAAPAKAATFTKETPYSQPAFDVVQKAGAPILAHVTAPWCSTRTAQTPIIVALRAEPPFSKLEIFNVDFDSQKPLLRKLGVRMQSTLIVYKGEQEEGCSSGETDPGAIQALLEKAN